MGTLIHNRSGSSGFSLDNSGRLEVSLDIALGEYVLDLDNRPLLFDQENVGTGSQSYSSTINGQTLSVTSNADAAVYQTKQRHPYFPGHSQQAEFTFTGLTPQTDVTKRVGYFGTSTVSPYTALIDGFYLESSGGVVSFNIAKSGSVISIAQSAWDDPLDGTGKSGKTIDWDNFQVFLIDFLYLGGTTVNLYNISQGRKDLVHSHHHANNFATVVMESPCQPIRAECRSTGGTGSFTFGCAQVSTLGSQAAFSGIPVSINTGTALIGAATSGTEYAAMGIRKNNPGREFFPKEISISSTAGAAAAYIWRLHINPTLSAGLTYSAVANTYVDEAAGDGSITVTTPGHVIASGTGVGRSQISLADISKAMRIGGNIDGTFDQLILSYMPLSNSQNFVATLTGINV